MSVSELLGEAVVTAYERGRRDAIKETIAMLRHADKRARAEAKRHAARGHYFLAAGTAAEAGTYGRLAELLSDEIKS